MTTPFGRADFFAFEAGEYLEHLTAVLAGEDAPSVDDFVRLTRALRGAAMLAGPAPLAKAAGALENVAKAYRDGGLGWPDNIRDAIGRSVAEFRDLVPRAAKWSEGDTARATGLTRALEAMWKAPGHRTQHPVAPGPALVPGEGPSIQAFVSREAARIAGALEAIGGHPPTDALQIVLARMQSLRGLAPVDDFAVLGALLEGLETMIGELIRGYPPPPTLAQILASACTALSTFADATEPTRPPEHEIATFAGLLYDGFAVETDVVPVATLLTADSPPFPETAARGVPDPVDLVSLGDRFRQTAAVLGLDQDDLSRRIHLYSLLATLRALPEVGNTPALRPLVEAIRAAVFDGSALARPNAVITALHAAAQPLGEAPSISIEDLAVDVALAAAVLREARAPKARVDGFENESDVVPIATLLLDDEPAVGGAGQSGPDRTSSQSTHDRTAMERSLSTLHRLGSHQAPSALPNSEATVPITELLLDEPLQVVPVETLLYRGAAARTRVEAVRHEIAAGMKILGEGRSLHPLIEELLDLVPLAFDDDN